MVKMRARLPKLVHFRSFVHGKCGTPATGKIEIDDVGKDSPNEQIQNSLSLISQSQSSMRFSYAFWHILLRWEGRIGQLIKCSSKMDKFCAIYSVWQPCPSDLNRVFRLSDKHVRLSSIVRDIFSYPKEATDWIYLIKENTRAQNFASCITQKTTFPEAFYDGASHFVMRECLTRNCIAFSQLAPDQRKMLIQKLFQTAVGKTRFLAAFGKAWVLRELDLWISCQGRFEEDVTCHDQRFIDSVGDLIYCMAKVGETGFLSDLFILLYGHDDLISVKAPVFHSRVLRNKGFLQSWFKVFTCMPKHDFLYFMLTNFPEAVCDETCISLIIKMLLDEGNTFIASSLLQKCVYLESNVNLARPLNIWIKFWTSRAPKSAYPSSSSLESSSLESSFENESFNILTFNDQKNSTDLLLALTSIFQNPTGNIIPDLVTCNICLSFASSSSIISTNDTDSNSSSPSPSPSSSSSSLHDKECLDEKLVSSILSYMQNNQMEPDHFTLIPLMRYHGRKHEFSLVRKVFEHIQRSNLSGQFALEVFLEACLENKEPKWAFQAIKTSVEEEGKYPDLVTFQKCLTLAMECYQEEPAYLDYLLNLFTRKRLSYERSGKLIAMILYAYAIQKHQRWSDIVSWFISFTGLQGSTEPFQNLALLKCMDAEHWNNCVSLSERCLIISSFMCGAAKRSDFELCCLVMDYLCQNYESWGKGEEATMIATSKNVNETSTSTKTKIASVNSFGGNHKSRKIMHVYEKSLNVIPAAARFAWIYSCIKLLGDDDQSHSRWKKESLNHPNDMMLDYIYSSRLYDAVFFIMKGFPLLLQDQISMLELSRSEQWKEISMLWEGWTLKNLLDGVMETIFEKDFVSKGGDGLLVMELEGSIYTALQGQDFQYLNLIVSPEMFSANCPNSHKIPFLLKPFVVDIVAVRVHPMLLHPKWSLLAHMERIKAGALGSSLKEVVIFFQQLSNILQIFECEGHSEVEGSSACTTTMKDLVLSMMEIMIESLKRSSIEDSNDNSRESENSRGLLDWEIRGCLSELYEQVLNQAKLETCNLKVSLLNGEGDEGGGGGRGNFAFTTAMLPSMPSENNRLEFCILDLLKLSIKNDSRWLYHAVVERMPVSSITPMTLSFLWTHFQLFPEWWLNDADDEKDEQGLQLQRQRRLGEPDIVNGNSIESCQERFFKEQQVKEQLLWQDQLSMRESLYFLVCFYCQRSREDRKLVASNILRFGGLQVICQLVGIDFRGGHVNSESLTLASLNAGKGYDEKALSSNSFSNSNASSCPSFSPSSSPSPYNDNTNLRIPKISPLTWQRDGVLDMIFLESRRLKVGRIMSRSIDKYLSSSSSN